MSLLEDLNEKIKSELHLKEYAEDEMENEVIDGEDFEDEELSDQEADDAQNERESNARIRVETESKIKGIIKNLDFEVDFRDLADTINDRIDGVVLTREKSHELFNIIREFLNF